MAATDSFAAYRDGLDTPYTNAVAVAVPSDTTDLPNVTRGIYVGGAGNLAVITEGGQTITLTAIAVGVIHRLRVTRVMATNTTATAIVALW